MLKDAIDLSSLRRVLVTKLRHHGDVLLASPVFTVLKNHAPHLEIDALVYQDTAEMLTLHPAISQVHTVGRQWKKAGALAQWREERALLARLRERRYDLIIHLTEHNRGAWLSRLLGTPLGVARHKPGKGRFWKNSFTHHYRVPRATKRHTVELDLDALRRAGIHPAPEDKRLRLTPGAEAESQIRDLLAQHGLAGKDFILFHPASRWLYKCWPVEMSAQLIAALQAEGHRVVLTAAPDPAERDMIRAILAQLPAPPVDLSGQLTLKQLAALAGEARLFIGMDSAPMHIAAAMQTPVAVLFGPTGEHEWGPWETPCRVLTSGHSCRPCGNDGCGGGKVSDCLAAIPVEAVLDAARQLLA